MKRTGGEEVVPDGEGGKTEAITIRFPVKLLARVEKIAKETQNNRTDTVLHLVRWGATQYESGPKRRGP